MRTGHQLHSTEIGVFRFHVFFDVGRWLGPYTWTACKGTYQPNIHDTNPLCKNFKPTDPQRPEFFLHVRFFGTWPQSTAVQVRSSGQTLVFSGAFDIFYKIHWGLLGGTAMLSARGRPKKKLPASLVFLYGWYIGSSDMRSYTFKYTIVILPSSIYA